MKESNLSERREKFLLLAAKNKARFEKHEKIKNEVFRDVDHKYLESAIKAGAINELFTLQLMDYAEKYSEDIIQQKCELLEALQQILKETDSFTISKNYIKNVCSKAIAKALD